MYTFFLSYLFVSWFECCSDNRGRTKWVVTPETFVQPVPGKTSSVTWEHLSSACLCLLFLLVLTSQVSSPCLAQPFKFPNCWTIVIMESFWAPWMTGADWKAREAMGVFYSLLGFHNSCREHFLPCSSWNSPEISLLWEALKTVNTAVS